MVVVVLASNVSSGVDQTAKPISERGKRRISCYLGNPMTHFVNQLLHHIIFGLSLLCFYPTNYGLGFGSLGWPKKSCIMMGTWCPKLVNSDFVLVGSLDDFFPTKREIWLDLLPCGQTRGAVRFNSTIPCVRQNMEARSFLHDGICKRWKKKKHICQTIWCGRDPLRWFTC